MNLRKILLLLFLSAGIFRLSLFSWGFNNFKQKVSPV